MILRVIDENLNEYIFNIFDKNYFVFTFLKTDNALPGNNLLTFFNFKDISIDTKIDLYNLFDDLQNKKLKTIIIENSDVSEEEEENEQQTFRKIFDNNMYDLEFVDLEYHTEYFTDPITTKSYEKVFFTFHFFKE